MRIAISGHRDLSRDKLDLYDENDLRRFPAPWPRRPAPAGGPAPGHLRPPGRQRLPAGPRAGRQSASLRWGGHTPRAVETLADFGLLTPLGDLFVDRMREAVTRMIAGPGAGPASWRTSLSELGVWEGRAPWSPRSPTRCPRAATPSTNQRSQAGQGGRSGDQVGERRRSGRRKRPITANLPRPSADAMASTSETERPGLCSECPYPDRSRSRSSNRERGHPGRGGILSGPLAPAS